MNTMKNEENTSKLLLPRLKSGTSEIQSGACGEWDVRSSDTFKKIASSLELEKEGNYSSNITAIPSVWARALLIETAIHRVNYPIHEKVVDKWFGMISAFAFAEIKSHPLSVQLIKLQDIKDSDAFANSLYQLMPSGNNYLYLLRGQQTSVANPWQELYVVLWNQVPVGITSPTTIVCPILEGQWDGLEWFRDNEIQSPARYLTEQHRQQLWGWLNRLKLNLGDYSGDLQSISNIRRVIDKCQSQLISHIPSSYEVPLSSEKQYFKEKLNRGCLELINTPIASIPKPSSVRLISSSSGKRNKKSTYELLIYDEAISVQWDLPRSEIYFYQQKTFATENLLADLETGLLTAWQESDEIQYDWINANTLFNEELYFISNTGENTAQIINCLLPKGSYSLTYNEKQVFPILPVNSILLDFFTPRELCNRLSFHKIQGTDFEYELTLDLTLSGYRDNKPENFRCTRKYILKEENDIQNVPVIEIWPNLIAEGWKNYYVFYYDQELGADTFSINLPHSYKENPFKDERGDFKVSMLNEFPDYIECFKGNDERPTSLGILLTDTPPTYGDVGTTKWTVGVDFGTSFTNVFTCVNDTPEKLELDGLILSLSTSDPTIRRFSLIKYFTPDIKDLLKLPFSTILSTKVSQKQKNTKGKTTEYLFPHIDGNVYFPSKADEIGANDGSIISNLKWTLNQDERKYAKLFIQHLALKISAAATVNGVQNIDWRISYPSAFSTVDLNTYSDLWTDTIRQLNEETGIENDIPKLELQSDNWRTESVSVAQYFASYEDKDLIRSTCIDIGGGTSDISIWERYDLVHQCSIKFAGYHMLTQFIEADQDLAKLIFPAVKITRKKFESQFNWNLKSNGETILREQRDSLIKKAKVKKLVRLVAISYCGLYYYVGILLRALHLEGLYTRDITTSIFLAGNGARIINWLAEGGRFDSNREINSVLSDMLAAGSNFNNESYVAPTVLSSNPKDEVACGLVLDSVSLQGWTSKQKKKEKLIAGENCNVNGKEISPYDRININKGTTIKQFFIQPPFKELQKFIQAFNNSIESLDDPYEPIKISENDIYALEKIIESDLLRTRGKSSDEISVEPPFILALKALLKLLT